MQLSKALLAAMVALEGSRSHTISHANQRHAPLTTVTFILIRWTGILIRWTGRCEMKTKLQRTCSLSVTLADSNFTEGTPTWSKVSLHYYGPLATRVQQTQGLVNQLLPLHWHQITPDCITAADGFPNTVQNKLIKSITSQNHHVKWQFNYEIH